MSLIETRGAGKVGPGTVHLARVEIRMRPASDGGFHPVLERMREAGGLVPTTSSRYEAARRATGLPEASGPFLGETRLDPRMTAREAAFAILRRHAAQLMRREPGSRLGLDPEELHRMRVAVRRMRSAMRLYRRVLPESVSELAPELKWAGRALGPTRDLDVQLEGLAHRIATLPPTRRADLRPLENRLRRQREIARREMLAALDSTRWVRLVGRLRHRLPTVPPATRRRANRPVAAVAPRLVRRRWKKLQAAAKSLGPDRPARSYHATRILAKRMRYGLEGHRSLWGRPAKRLIDRLVAVQDVLGEHQDAVVAQSRIDDLLRERESLPAATIERLEEWRRDERRRERRLRRDFRKAYRDLRRGVDRDAPFR